MAHWLSYSVRFHGWKRTQKRKQRFAILEDKCVAYCYRTDVDDMHSTNTCVFCK